MSRQTLFLEPLDVLFLRGNKLFGDAGSFGEALVPPWPSAGAGAIRSRMLVDQGIDPAAFARGEVEHPALGTPSSPGPFRLSSFQLARRFADGRVELLMPLPADLVVSAGEGGLEVRALRPFQPAPELLSSAPLPWLAVLADDKRGKPARGYWLDEQGWHRYLQGETPGPDSLVREQDLWAFDLRIGVGLDRESRSAAEGRLFAVQAVATVKRGYPLPRARVAETAVLQKADYDIGFLAVVAGATPPQGGTVRFGGDGRAAALQAVDKDLPAADLDAIAQARRCRLVLTSPGLFDLGQGGEGWLPTGARPDQRRSDGAIRFALHGVCGWILCAAVPRYEVISGWDLARWRPKVALRAVPQGSVYWLELDAGVSAESLDKLVAEGLWSEICEDPMRRAEGFNRIALARWGD